MDFKDFHPELATPAQGRERMERFYQLPEAEQQRYWETLRQQIDSSREAKLKRSTPDRSSLPRDVHERLLGVDASSYVRAIAGVEVAPGKRACCPLPTHEDRSWDFSVRDRRWRCFGCNRGGNIYDLASAVWGVPLQGQSFKELQERLHGMRLA